MADRIPRTGAPENVRDTLAANIKRIRKLRDMNGRDFIAQLQDRGVKLLPSGLTALEKGERRLSVEELLAIAIVLNTSVIDLLIPPSGASLEVAEGVDPLPPAWLETWLRGDTPWPAIGENDEAFFSTASEDRKAMHRIGLQPEVVEVNLLKSLIREAIEGPENAVEPEGLAELMRDHAGRVNAYVDLLASRIEKHGYGPR